MVKAVIFDLDGTLMDTLTDLYAAVNRALESFGFAKVSKEKVRMSVGNGVAKLVERCLPSDAASVYDRVLSRFNAEYARCQKEHTVPFDGVVETLAKLKAAGIKIAVVSNKTESAVKALCDENFPGLTDVAVGDNGLRPLKPDPLPLYYALEQLGVSKKDAVYVGDQEVDVCVSKNSGIPLIAAAWGFRGKKALMDAGATTICDKMPDILLYL